LVIGKDNPGIESTGFGVDGRVTAEMLDGVYWFKPRGSVETADPNRQMQNFNMFLQTVAMLSKVNPAIAQIMSTVPAAKALMEQAVRLMKFPNKQALLGSETNSVFDAMQAAQEQQQQQQQVMADPRMQLIMAMAGSPQMGGQPDMAGMPPQQGQPPQQQPVM
jgi:hypothetical protein